VYIAAKTAIICHDPANGAAEGTSYIQNVDEQILKGRESELHISGWAKSTRTASLYLKF
jgi:hypothetical protein